MRAKLESGWFFTPTGELRACIILTIGDTRKVRDLETGMYVDVRPEDVLIEQPEPTE